MPERTQTHQRKYRFHRFTFRASLFIIFLSSVGLLFFMNVSDAANANISFFLRIGDPPPIVESRPPVAIEGGGSSGTRLAYLVQPVEPVTPTEPSPSLSPAEVTVNLIVDGSAIEGGSVSRELAQSAVPQFTSRRPTFRGVVGVAEALLFLEVHSSDILTASFNANKDGSWEWTPPRDLDVGSHIFYITVFDPSGKVKLGSAALQFQIVSPETQTVSADQGAHEVRTDVKLPPSLVSERKVLFDIRINILGPEQHSIQPGDVLSAQVSLLNIGSPGYIVDAQVHYSIIENATDKIVFQESETIGVSTQASYLKSFGTKPTMRPGVYRLEASVTYGDTEAFATDEFTVDGPPVIATSSTTRINVSTVIEVLFVILALALLVMYTEFHTVELLQGVVRQVSENDLKKYGFL